MTDAQVFDLSVPEAHKILYHYTNAAGLAGIIRSQQLWATDISYLNDVEEHTGYFDRRLPRLLERVFETTYSGLPSDSKLRNALNAGGDSHAAMRKGAKETAELLRHVSLTHNFPYVTSFSAVPRECPDDGLLSQWRGYGHEGGYALVFDTAELEKLLKKEGLRFKYAIAWWSDVEYFENYEEHIAVQTETVRNESLVRKWAEEFFLTLQEGFAANQSESLYSPLTMLSCTHKHFGFREEREIRIVAVLPTKEVEAESRSETESRLSKSVHFRASSGGMVPYLSLFGGGLDGSTGRLPIKKIIIGPHEDKYRREKAVRKLLEENGILAEVVVSDIPYVGR